MTLRNFFLGSECEGERCWCNQPAAHKVEEAISNDDPNFFRHPLTAYVCHAHFVEMMGPAAKDIRDFPVNTGYVNSVVPCFRGSHCEWPACPRDCSGRPGKSP